MLGVLIFCVKHANLRVRWHIFVWEKVRRHRVAFRSAIGSDTMRRGGPDGYHAAPQTEDVS